MRVISGIVGQALAGVVVDCLGRLIGLVERQLSKPKTPTLEEVQDLYEDARRLRDLKESN